MVKPVDPKLAAFREGMDKLKKSMAEKSMAELEEKIRTDPVDDAWLSALDHGVGLLIIAAQMNRVHGWFSRGHPYREIDIVVVRDMAQDLRSIAKNLEIAADRVERERPIK